MQETSNSIDILIGKYLSGNISKEEKEEILNWKEASNNNRLVFNSALKAWKNSVPQFSESMVTNDKSNIHKKINQKLTHKIKSINRKNFIYKIAATIAIPVGLIFGWLIFNLTDANITQGEICELSSPKGNISKCILPDGTEVWVNTNSTIKYKTGSFLNKNREVELNGEAYFLVAKNQKLPFKVKTRLGNVQVTGTEFNVKCYPETNSFETVLSEGSIELCFHTNQDQKIKLNPGERAVFSAGLNSINISQTDAELFSSWRNGQIIFKDATLNDLIKELERIYDISFYLENNEIGKFRFRGMFSYNNNLIDALEKIKKTTELDYYIENKKVTLTKQ